MKKAVLKKFLNIQRKIAGLQLYKKGTPTQSFPLNVANFLKTPILKSIC